MLVSEKLGIYILGIALLLFAGFLLLPGMAMLIIMNAIASCVWGRVN